MRFVLLPEGILPPVPVFLANCSVYISLVNLPISSQLPFTTISTVSESTLSVELHTQLQMKSFLKEGDLELSVVCLLLTRAKSLSNGSDVGGRDNGELLSK